MRGVVAACGPEAAWMGARILDAGGNAADAAVAATLTVFLAAPMMTSAAGGGLAVIDDPERGGPEFLDFFTRVPGLPAGSLDPMGHDFLDLPVHYGPGITQVFHVGRGAASVPTALAGLIELHRRHGALPLSAICAPVEALARRGVIVQATQALFHRLFEEIIRYGTTRRLFAPGGPLIQTGARLRNPAYADTLAWIGEHGRDPLTDGYLVEPLLATFGAPGGFLTREDLSGYRPETGPPLRHRYREAEVLLPGPPSEGGVLVALALRLLEQVDMPADPHAPRKFRLLAAAEQTVHEARASDPAGWAGLAEEGAAKAWRPRFEELLARGGQGAEAQSPLPGNTSHVSAVDERGVAVAVTTSFGESCGYLVPGLGLPMNNFLGEAEINPRGFHADPPGTRLTSMMTPCVVRGADGRVTALGTGGADRIPGLVLGAVVHLVDFGLAPAAAVAQPRIHRSSLKTVLETAGLPEDTVLELQGRYPDLRMLPEPHLYFGGLHMASRAGGGGLDAAGDRRRDGRGARGGTTS